MAVGVTVAIGRPQWLLAYWRRVELCRRHKAAFERMTLEKQLAHLARDLERKVNEAQKLGDVPTLLKVANASRDRLEEAAGAVGRVPEEDQGIALKTAQRIGYNSAADVWPGWEISTPARSEAELQAAQTIVRRSSAPVEQLGPSALERGNTIWLIGALDLARGRREEALAAFDASSRILCRWPRNEAVE